MAHRVTDDADRTDPISPLFCEVPAYHKGDPDTVVGPDAAVAVPTYCEKFDFELELAIVIGWRGKNIAKADAHRYIAGYTIWNDFSARDQQMRPRMSIWATLSDRTSPRPMKSTSRISE